MTAERFRIIVIILWLVTIAIIYDTGKTGRYALSFNKNGVIWIVDTRSGICYESFDPCLKGRLMYKLGKGYFCEETTEELTKSEAFKAYDKKRKKQP
jgi:hypothetical protein